MDKYILSKTNLYMDSKAKGAKESIISERKLNPIQKSILQDEEEITSTKNIKKYTLSKGINKAVEKNTGQTLDREQVLVRANDIYEINPQKQESIFSEKPSLIVETRIPKVVFSEDKNIFSGKESPKQKNIEQTLDREQVFDQVNEIYETNPQKQDNIKKPSTTDEKMTIKVVYSEEKKEDIFKEKEPSRQKNVEQTLNREQVSVQANEIYTKNQNKSHQTLIKDCSNTNIADSFCIPKVMVSNRMINIEFNQQNSTETQGQHVSMDIKGVRYIGGMGVALSEDALSFLRNKNSIHSNTKKDVSNIKKESYRQMKGTNPQSEDLTNKTILGFKNTVLNTVDTYKNTKETLRIAQRTIRAIVSTIKTTAHLVKILLSVVAEFAIPILLILVVVVVANAFVNILTVTHTAEIVELNEVYNYITEIQTQKQNEFENFDYLNINSHLEEDNVTYTEDVDFPEPMNLLNYYSAKYKEELVLNSDVKRDIEEFFNAYCTIDYNYYTRTTTINNEEIEVPHIDIYFTQNIIYDDFITEAIESKAIDEEYYNTLLEYGFYVYETLATPFEQYEISSTFGYRVHPISNEISFHRAVDIPKPQGTPIDSVISGIAKVQVSSMYGNMLEIISDGERVMYAHCDSILVETGDYVSRGQAVALVGTTGNSTGNHLHLEYYINNELMNPLFYLPKIEREENNMED